MCFIDVIKTVMKKIYNDKLWYLVEFVSIRKKS